MAKGRSGRLSRMIRRERSDGTRVLLASVAGCLVGAGIIVTALASREPAAGVQAEPEQESDPVDLDQLDDFLTDAQATELAKDRMIENGFNPSRPETLDLLPAYKEIVRGEAKAMRRFYRLAGKDPERAEAAKALASNFDLVTICRIHPPSDESIEEMIQRELPAARQRLAFKRAR